jgi:outer membrane biogenesis lipoprotein LolB
MKRILLLGLVTVSAMLSACSSMYERATASTEDEKVLRPIGSDRLGDF